MEKGEMESLRCGTCRVQFNKSELHRSHFKSDWHLYNIKRKVTLESLTPRVRSIAFLSRNYGIKR